MQSRFNNTEAYSNASSPIQPTVAGPSLGDAYVLNVKVPFCQKAQTFGVLAILAYCDALIFGVDSDYCHLFPICSFADADFADCCWFEGILDECGWVFTELDNFVFFTRHTLEGMDVASALADCYADLTLVYYENCTFLFFVNYTIFHASAADAFKECNVSHFVAGDFYASCDFFSSLIYFILLLFY
jgi:hypothetical protein